MSQYTISHSMGNSSIFNTAYLSLALALPSLPLTPTTSTTTTELLRFPPLTLFQTL